MNRSSKARPLGVQVAPAALDTLPKLAQKLLEVYLDLKRGIDLALSIVNTPMGAATLPAGTETNVVEGTFYVINSASGVVSVKLPKPYPPKIIYFSRAVLGATVNFTAVSGLVQGDPSYTLGLSVGIRMLCSDGVNWWSK